MLWGPGVRVGRKRDGEALSVRTAERIVRQTAQRAGLPKEVSCMTLRHSDAVAQLRAGTNIRELQVRLGHQSVKTTLKYSRYLTADRVVSPADRLNCQAAGIAPYTAATGPAASPTPPVSAADTSVGQQATAERFGSTLTVLCVSPSLALALNALTSVQFHSVLKSRQPSPGAGVCAPT